MLTEPDAGARAGEGEFAFAPGGRVRKPVIGGVVPFSTVDWPGKLVAVGVDALLGVMLLLGVGELLKV